MLSPFFVPHLLVSDVGIRSLVDMLHECPWRPPNQAALELCQCGARIPDAENLIGLGDNATTNLACMRIQTI